jgi:hypothetical protein
MLNHAFVAQELDRIATGLFKEVRSLSWLNQKVWQQIVTDPIFIAHAQAAAVRIAWSDSLAQCHDEVAHRAPYAVLAVDGSQIYPDYHIEGIDCFLINAGGAFFSYADPSSVTFFSQPSVYVPDAFLALFPHLPFSADMVDLMREDHEFSLMAEKAVQLRANEPTKPFVALFDGNLLFWHLEGKQDDVKEVFAQRYMQSLQKLYEANIVTAGYLSASRFKNIVELLNIGIAEGGASCGLSGEQLYALCSRLGEVSDNTILSHVLAIGQRTPLLACKGDIIEHYPAHLKPYFFYLNVGSEVVRIEVPAWVAADMVKVSLVCGIALDQVEKGRGYPVALAEAHVQAVVTAGERDFFYSMVHARGIKHNKRVMLSQKGLKKRLLGV